MAAASVIADDFDDEFLKCAICMGLFKDPKLLPCFHTFCRSCLEHVAHISGRRGFSCPKCRSDVELECPVQLGGVDYLKSNFYINKLLDFRKLKQCTTSNLQCQLCESGAQAVAVCGDCKFLCNNCVTAHRNMPATEDHVIVTLDDLEDPAMRSQYARQVYCPRHKQRMAFYCEPCVTLVCRDCAVAKHRDRPGESHDPRELDEVAPKHRDSVVGLMKKAKDVASEIKQQVEELDKELTTTGKNCDQEKKEIQQHYKTLRRKLKQEEKQMITKVEKVKEVRKRELAREKQKIAGQLGKTEEGLTFCQNVLDRDNNSEFLSLREQMEERLRLLASHKTSKKTFEYGRTVCFQPSSVSQVSGGSLTVFGEFNIDVEEPAVESLPCSVTVTTDSAADVTGGNVAPQIEVTSPQGETTLLQTAVDTGQRASGSRKRIRVSETWGAVWRPKTTGKHSLSVCMGDRKDLGSLTVDVGSNNPVLRFGQKGSQPGQFDSPIDVAVRGDRLYVADSFNKRVQVFDLSGKFCSSFSTNATPGSLAVQTNGTIVTKCGEKQVKTFLPSGELLHKFPLGEHCTTAYGLAAQKDGRVVIADPYKHSMFLFEADGTLVKQVGGQGQGEGQLNNPCFVCVDEEDNIIVSDTFNSRIQVFDKDLNFKHKFGQKGRESRNIWDPLGVSADSRGNIVLANMGGTTDGVEHSKKLQVFCPDGTWVSTISSDGDKLNLPHGVAVTEDGHVFLTDTEDHCVRKYRYM